MVSLDRLPWHVKIEVARTMTWVQHCLNRHISREAPVLKRYTSRLLGEVFSQSNFKTVYSVGAKCLSRSHCVDITVQERKTQITLHNAIVRFIERFLILSCSRFTQSSVPREMVILNFVRNLKICFSIAKQNCIISWRTLLEKLIVLLPSRDVIYKLTLLRSRHQFILA